MNINKQLRIAITVIELRPGGMERLVVHLAKGLSRQGIPVMVICLQNPGNLASELIHTKVEFRAIQSLKRIDYRAVGRLRKLLLNFRPSVINVHDYASVPYAMAANWLSDRVPLIFTAHGLLYQGFEHLRRRYRFFSKGYAGITAVSDAVAKRHNEYLGWSRPIEIIGNGVPVISRDENLRSGVRVELGIRANDFFFLTVGNPRPEKGIEDLIDAVVKLRDNEDIGHFTVAVAGKMANSEYCRMLIHKIETYGIEKEFRFLGFRNDTQALYSAADALVLPSRSEGLPMVVLEAMMAGLPVVATRVGGVPGAVGECGLLVEPENATQLAAAMARILKSRELRKKLGRKARKKAMNTYSVDKMVDHYIAYYKHVVHTGN